MPALCPGGGPTRGDPGPDRSADPGVARLAANAEPADDRPVALDVVAPHVVEQPATATDDLHQPAPGVVVALVHLEVLGEERDALGEERDLHLGRPRVGVV